MKLFIPILCYNHTCHTSYMMSLFQLILTLKEHNVDASFFPITFESLISRARNAAVAHFMSNEQYTHLLFIDSDIEFKPEDVFKLIQANKPVVSAGYPQKWLHTGKMEHVFSEKPVPDTPLELCTVHSTHLFPYDQDIKECMTAKYCTTGFLLIQRNVIEKMMEAYPERQYVNDIDGYMSANSQYFYDLFTVEVNQHTKKYESEDYGFSRLWTQLGGEIHIVTNISLKHYGWYGFSGNLYRQLIYTIEHEQHRGT